MSESVARGTRQRKTQAERRAEAEAGILDATVSCLADQGWEGTTSAGIARTAGVSVGSVFRYFPTTTDLYSAAVERCLGAARREGVASIARSIEGLDARSAIPAVLSGLWDAYQEPEVLAAVELYAVARTDPSIAEALGRVEPVHRVELIAGTQALMPEPLNRAPALGDYLELAVDMVVGGALRSLALGPEGAAEAKRLVVDRFSGLLIGEAVRQGYLADSSSDRA